MTREASAGAEPTVTIVTPSFQQARFLRATIESVAAQGRSDIEHIVMDGGSTDGSVEILKSYGDRLRWISEPDRGQAHALNKGFRMARGRILAWINSDDILLPGAVDAAVAAFDADPALGLVCGAGRLIDERGALIAPFPYTEPFNLRRLLYFGDTILQQSAYFRRDAFESVGGLDESLRWTLDWDLFIRLGMQRPARTLTTEMGAIRVHGATKTATGGRQRLAEIQRMLARHTGGKRTPAYWGAWLETWNGRLSGRAWRNAHDWLARRIFPRMEECCGWLHDGWATRRVDLVLPRLGGGELTIQGEQPPGGGELRISVDGGEVRRETPRPGPFEMRLSVPGGSNEAVALCIDASQVLRRRGRLHGGRQSLCWRLGRVTLDGASGETELVPPPLLISPDLDASEA